MTALLLLRLLSAPLPDSLLVDVLLAPTQQHVLVDAVLTHDSTVLLPSAPVYQLLGIGTPTGTWTTPAILEAAYPTVRVVWQPRELRVVILDNLNVLPASRRATAQQLSQARFATQLAVRSGPYAALSWDDGGSSVLGEAGYTWRSRITIAGQADYQGRGAWAVSATPLSHLFVTAQGARGAPTQVGGRIGVGPLWLSATYAGPTTPIQASGVLRAGPVQVFGSRDLGVATWQPNDAMTVTVARQWATQRTAFRLSVGQGAPFSPFAIPATALR